MSSGISTKPEQAGKGAPFLSFGTIYSNYILPDVLDDRMDTTPAEQEKYSIRYGDVFLTRTSETIDELAMSSVALKNYPTATFSGFAKRLRPLDCSFPNPAFMAFYLRSPHFRKIIECMTTMTTRASFNEDLFSFLNVTLPSLDEQFSIGELLVSIEKKQTINKQINDNLQHMMATLYDYWFTQFNFPDDNGVPYKSSGGKMVWNEELKMHIPAGWKCIRLGDILTKNVTEIAPSKPIPTIDLSVMPSDSFALAMLNNSGKFNTNLYEMNEGDLLFGGIRPYLHKAGIAPCSGAVAGTVRSFHVKRPDDYNYALFTLCSKTMFNYAESVSTGTRMPTVSSNDLLARRVAYNPDISARFNSIDVRGTIINNVQDSLALQSLRDWLLPLLMNGQATIKQP